MAELTIGPVEDDGGRAIYSGELPVFMWYADEMSKDDALEQAAELDRNYKNGARIIAERKQARGEVEEFMRALFGSISRSF